MRTFVPEYPPPGGRVWLQSILTYGDGGEQILASRVVLSLHVISTFKRLFRGTLCGSTTPQRSSLTLSFCNVASRRVSGPRKIRGGKRASDSISDSWTGGCLCKPDSEVLKPTVRRHYTCIWNEFSAAPRARSITVSERNKLILCSKSYPLLIAFHVFRGLRCQYQPFECRFVKFLA